jgi:hypothetical protein
MANVAAICPRCERPLDERAPACAACGLSLSVLDEQFGEDCVVLDRVTDAAHVLRLAEKDSVIDAIEHFERSFPQLFVTVYLGVLPRHASLRLFGFWLLNRAAVTAVEINRPNESGALVVADMRSKALGLTLGYHLEALFSKKELIGILGAACGAFGRREYGEGLVHCVNDFSRVLQKKLRKGMMESRSYADSYSPLGGGIDELPRLRQGHRRGLGIDKEEPHEREQ